MCWHPQNGGLKLRCAVVFSAWLAEYNRMGPVQYQEFHLSAFCCQRSTVFRFQRGVGCFEDLSTYVNRPSNVPLHHWEADYFNSVWVFRGRKLRQIKKYVIHLYHPPLSTYFWRKWLTQSPGGNAIPPSFPHQALNSSPPRSRSPNTSEGPYWDTSQPAFPLRKDRIRRVRSHLSCFI